MKEGAADLRKEVLKTKQPQKLELQERTSAVSEGTTHGQPNIEDSQIISSPELSEWCLKILIGRYRKKKIEWSLRLFRQQNRAESNLAVRH
jgi:hypothetical protein